VFKSIVISFNYGYNSINSLKGKSCLNTIGVTQMGKTDFGFKQVDIEKKEGMVQEIFSSVASSYDLMNDLMSLGMHRAWKRQFVDSMRPQPGDKLLDVAGGTGDIARRFLRAGGDKAVVCDLNQEMLAEGRKLTIDQSPELLHDLEWQHGNAEELPFEDSSFDVYAISFGIRNVTHQQKALEEAWRVLKPGGRFFCMELCTSDKALVSRVYDLYSFKVIPRVGKMVAGDAEAYQYLVESIRRFPKPPRFKRMIMKAGFQQVSYKTLNFGTVAIHQGIK
jgi:demethylmenaquinone methyltransferase/2-methoxy-6-polyprenyl-1,4-benzoquinol methylase